MDDQPRCSQVFSLMPVAGAGFESPPTVFKLRFTFHGSTDFYGRVTVYKLAVLGTEVA